MSQSCRVNQNSGDISGLLGVIEMKGLNYGHSWDQIMGKIFHLKFPNSFAVYEPKRHLSPKVHQKYLIDFWALVMG
jgi:hypothetical protein